MRWTCDLRIDSRSRWLYASYVCKRRFWAVCEETRDGFVREAEDFVLADK
jgi:hypothetical protein